MDAPRSGGRANLAAALRWTPAVIAASAALTTVTLAVLNRGSIHHLNDANPIESVMPISFAVVGLLITGRQRRNPVGWLFLFMAVDVGLSGAAIQYARLAQLTRPGLPGAAWAQWEFSSVGALTYPSGAASLTMLLIPDGRLISPRWRPAIWASLVLTPAIAVLAAVTPGQITGLAASLPALDNPIGVAGLQPSAANAASLAASLAGLALSVVAAAAPLVRLRRARGEQRQQLKWIAYAIITSAVVTVAAILVGVAPSLQDASNSAAALSVALGFGVALPVATALAIFKHRLYDVDVVIGRTLVYGALAAMISAIYVGIAVGIGALVGSGGSPNLGLSILATAVVAVVFQPVRERLQRLANRLVYGRRATPYETLSDFSQRVAESYALDEVLPRMARVLTEGTAAERADVWLSRDGFLRPAASWPEAAPQREPIDLSNGDGDPTFPVIPGTSRVVVVRHAGRLLGALTVTTRSGEALTPIEDRLLVDLANQAGLVLRNAGLATELMQRLDELRTSRQRLVRAQDMERRRIERDLHDGAQQQLVALKVKLGLAKTLATADPARTAAALDELRADADEAIATLRDLAHGIYPPLLAERGLATAISAHARHSGLSVDVDAGGVARYPEQVESCVYFCCLEALQNTSKHASAQHVSIRLAQDNGTLRFEVTDDGRGFDVASVRRGAGIENMRDRLEGVGGRLEIHSQRGRGTTLAGELPVTTTPD